MPWIILEGYNMFCPKCGAEIMDGSEYCPQCSEDLTALIKPRENGAAKNIISPSIESGTKATKPTKKALIQRWWVWVIIGVVAAYAATVLNGAWYNPKVQFLIFWREAPDKVVSSALDTVKNQDWTKARTYWGNGSFGGDNATDAGTMEKVVLVVKHLSYEIQSIKMTKDTATVTTKITNTDMRQIVSELFNEALQNAFSNGFSGNSDSDAEMEAIFKRLMERDNNPMVNATVDIQLKLTDGKWVIQPTDKILDAMMGGMYSATSNLGRK